MAATLAPVGQPSVAGGQQTPMAAASPAAAASTGPEDLYLRYYVRFGPKFDFGAGGVLPGLCGGKCGGPGLKNAPGREGWVIRPRWLRM